MALQLIKMDYQKPVKKNGKKMIKSNISHHRNQCDKTESSNISKIQEINKTKKIIKREKYVMQLKLSEVLLLIKARSRMLSSFDTNLIWREESGR